MTQDHERLDPKTLKRPDELMLATGDILSWISAHRKQALLVASAALGVLLLGVGAMAWMESAREAERAEFAESFRAYAALDHEASQKGFTSFLEKHPRGELSNLGRIYLGTSALQKRNFEVARKAFDGLLESSPGAIERQLAHYNLGVIDRETGKREEARAHFRSAAEMNGPVQVAARIALSADLGDGGKAMPAIPGLDRVPDDIVEYIDARAPKTS